MLRSWIDHITVTAPSLASGVDYVSRALGVTPQPGGAHPRMGTHNCLLKLGETMFLEVIAVDPQAPPPNRPRWFALDSMTPQQPPRLAMWVARTSDIHIAVRASPPAVGVIEPMRRGELDWLISIPEDGSLPLDGIAPALIQWQAEAHPASRMPDLGCSLLGLHGYHAQAARIGGMLDAIGFEDGFSLAIPEQGRAPCLIADILTPHGPRRLGAET